jgi:transposase
MTCKKIKEELDNDNICISKRTIAERLNNNGFSYKKPACEPLLSNKQKTARIKWAEDNINTN